ncbi:hypothetical protein ACH5RR_020182 [Cinchona calisaya]|uniref:FLZ-type domain-containing protein n=1 Tax=Cinchona calisaya TaxID=153742 RepID=A0ABD2ZIQ0_9GENT
MTDYSSLASSPTTPTQSTSSSITSSFLGSPRIFNGLLGSKILPGAESATTPTSILDTKPLSNFVNPFGYDKKYLFASHNSSLENNTSIHKHTYDEKVNGIGLALVDSLNNEKNDDNVSKPNSKMILFGANLKVQIPSLPPSGLSPAATPKSPADFGIKTRNSIFLGSLSGFGSPSSCNIRRKDSPVESVQEGRLSLNEMELSEDYTCVITHGPNPKTTHIFDDCVVENCCGIVKLSDLGKDCSFSDDDCKDNLGNGKDIFMYRGEKAFCSHEWRCQEMVAEGEKNLGVEDDFIT